jgi:hypothetical protein
MEKKLIALIWSKKYFIKVREVAALIRVSGVPFMNYAHLNQVWKLKRF